jgi:16S rRNA G527 N7-methylase RsmG
VYSAPIQNEEALDERMFDACQTIRKRPETFERVRQSEVTVRALSHVNDILSVCYKMQRDKQ